MEPENSLLCSQQLVSGFFVLYFSFVICNPLLVVYMQSVSVFQRTYCNVRLSEGQIIF